VSRILICGGPRTGKTTLAAEIGPQVGGAVHHTDDLIPLGWSEASQAAALLLEAPGPWIVEGVAAARALRKWRQAHPGERPPVDRIIYMETPHVALTPGQATMAKGVATVYGEVEDWIEDHGVVTEYR
jgi:adenylate kinase family enzyme